MVIHPQFPPSVWIGHGQLRVADLERARVFYSDVLGFTVTAYGLAVGLHAVFLAGGDRRDRIALTTWLGRGGLHHITARYLSWEALAEAVRRVIKHSQAIDDVNDYGASIAVYLRDPDGNRVELYYNRPRSERYDGDRRPVKNARIDVRELLTDAQAV